MRDDSPSRVLWTHVDTRPASPIHRRWAEVVSGSAQRLGYRGVQAVISAARLRGPHMGLSLVSVFALSAPTTSQLRALIEELPAEADGDERLVDVDAALMRELRAAAPDALVASSVAGELDDGLQQLLGG